ncbi:beta-ketoacyl-ACP synthase III [Rhodococcus koreensis]|uniref:beta-ketoacyl-ACP synthase III n=1 Tax=Rhodococcus koreensis TaxID=99653 RepID=UPI001981C425|nr:beta-ketoacyl-ACP synthase III [Rhodococcus koreensis]QSE84823.1 ketoacyl-ACP synthase III [Rhodococcus koreensis]
MAIPITNSQEIQNSSILGLGVHRPRRVVTNDDICRQIDSTDEWIRVRSGIRVRRFAGPDETLIDMAVRAGRDALRSSAVPPDQIGCVIVATSTFPYQTPAAGPQIAHQLGITGSAFDVSAGCAGFCLALALASDVVRGRTASHVLVIGVERLSEFVDFTDKSTAFIFSDGAGAVVVGPSDEPGIGPVEWGSDGSQAHALTQHPSLTTFRDNPMGPPPTVRMDGPAIFRWAVSEMEKVSRSALDRAGVAIDQVDAFIPHQANLRITEAITKRLKLKPATVVARDIVEAGNTSAASVPLAMETLLRTGDSHAGDTALLVGFGAGLTYAAQVVTLPAAPQHS